MAASQLSREGLSSREAPYSAQKEIVNTLRRNGETPSRGGTRGGAAAAPDESEYQPPKDFRKVLDMMGRSNHSAMQELFLGGGLPPTLSDTAVTVSFEMFQSVQERLVSTRIELEKAKESLITANQRAATMQMQSVADRERVLNVEKKLEQISDYAQQLRRSNAELSMTIQSKEGERLRLEEERNNLRMELTTLSLKQADTSNELAHTKAQCSRLEAQVESLRSDMKTALDRHADQLAQAAQQANAIAKKSGSEVKVAALTSQVTRLKTDLDEALEERAIDKANLTRQQQRYKSIAAAARARFEAGERATMQLAETLTRTHREHSDAMNLLISAQSKNAEVDKHANSLQRLLSMNRAKEQETEQSLSAVFGAIESIKAAIDATELPAAGAAGHGASDILDSVCDTAKAFTSSALEAVRLLCQADRLFGTSSTLAEALEQWIDLKSRMTNPIGRFATSGAEAFEATFAEAPRAEAGMVQRGHTERNQLWLDKVAAEYRLIMPSTDAEILATETMADAAAGHDADAPVASFFSGCGAMDANTDITKPPSSFTVDQDAWTDVDFKIPDWVLRLPQPPASLQAVPQQLFEDLPQRFASFHQKLTALTALLRKRMNLNVAQATDPLSFADRIGVKVDITDCWQVVQLDEELIMAVLAAMLQGKDEAIRRLLHHKTRSDLHSNDRTLEKLKTLPKTERNTKLSFKDRQELSLFRSNRGAMEQDVRGAFFDNNALLLAVQEELEGGGADVGDQSIDSGGEDSLMTPPSVAKSLEVPGITSPPARALSSLKPAAASRADAGKQPSFLNAKATASSAATPKGDAASAARQLLRDTVKSKTTARSTNNLRAVVSFAVKASGKSGGAAPSSSPPAPGGKKATPKTGTGAVTILTPSDDELVGPKSGGGVEHHGAELVAADDPPLLQIQPDMDDALFTDDDDDDGGDATAAQRLPQSSAATAAANSSVSSVETARTLNTLTTPGSRRHTPRVTSVPDTATAAVQTESHPVSDNDVQTVTCDVRSAATSPIMWIRPGGSPPQQQQQTSRTSSRFTATATRHATVNDDPSSSVDKTAAVAGRALSPVAQPLYAFGTPRAASNAAPGLARLTHDPLGVADEDPLMLQLQQRRPNGGPTTSPGLGGGGRRMRSPSQAQPPVAVLQPMPSVLSGTAVASVSASSSGNGAVNRRASKAFPAVQRKASAAGGDDALAVVPKGPPNPLWVLDRTGATSVESGGDMPTSPSRSMSISAAAASAAAGGNERSPLMVHRMSVSTSNVLPSLGLAGETISVMPAPRQPQQRRQTSPPAVSSPSSSSAASPGALPDPLLVTQPHSHTKTFDTPIPPSQTQRPTTVPTRPSYQQPHAAPSASMGSGGASRSAEITAALEFAAQLRSARGQQGPPTFTTLQLSAPPPGPSRSPMTARTPASRHLTPSSGLATPRADGAGVGVLGLQFNRSATASPESFVRTTHAAAPAPPPTRSAARGGGGGGGNGTVAIGLPAILNGIPALARGPGGRQVADLASLLWPGAAPGAPMGPSATSLTPRQQSRQRARGIVAAQRRQLAASPGE